MKAGKLFKTIKTSAIMIGIFIAMGSLTSCEKVEDDTISPSANVDQYLIEEVVIVEPSDWQSNQLCREAKLDCSIFNKESEYDFLKVYIKVPKTRSSPTMWQELPFSDVQFNISDFKIFVKRNFNSPTERNTFKVEIKLKKNSSIKRSEAKLVSQNKIML